jgi:ketosteroid isomerase-like protein
MNDNSNNAPNKKEAMDPRAEIERLTAKFAKAVTDKDFAAIGPFYEERARFLPPGGPMVEGPAAILASIRKMVEAGITALDLHAVDVIESGDFVIEIGRTTVTIQPPGVMALVLLLMGKRRLIKQGKSIVVWRRQKDGSLKIMADTFNSN